MEKLQKVLLLRAGTACLAQELRYRPTRLLAAALWLRLKCKYFNSGTAKEACEAFVMRAKQLSKLLSGKVLLRWILHKETSTRTERRTKTTFKEKEEREGPVSHKR